MIVLPVAKRPSCVADTASGVRARTPRACRLSHLKKVPGKSAAHRYGPDLPAQPVFRLSAAMPYLYSGAYASPYYYGGAYASPYYVSYYGAYASPYYSAYSSAYASPYSYAYASPYYGSAYRAGLGYYY